MKTLEERFWAKVDKRGPDECWNWTASLSHGYGKISVNGKNVGAHRVSYLLANGCRPDELYVCHSCDNPKCVNPKHLWAGTDGDNTKDMVAKGRKSTSPGGKNPMTKLTEEQVLLIRKDKRPQSKIAQEYGTSQAAVSRIVTGKRWSCLSSDERYRQQMSGVV